MNDGGKDQLEAALGRHYTAQRAMAGSESIENLVQAMLAEEARASEPQRHIRSLPAFVAAQVRYIPAWTWAAQVLIVALMYIVAQMVGDGHTTRFAVGILSAATVLVGVPTLQASKLYGVAELEYSCPNNAASVLAARLIVLGSSSSLAVALMVVAAAASIDVSAFQMALWACPPYFASCAGSLALLRRAAPSTAGTLCIAWISICSAALLAAGHALPSLYAQASITTWAVASAFALAWLAREVVQTCRAAAAGLDTFSPHMAKTYN